MDSTRLIGALPRARFNAVIEDIPVTSLWFLPISNPADALAVNAIVG